MRRVIGIEDLDSVTLFLQIRLHAIPRRAELRGAVAVLAHARVAPVLGSADEIGCWRRARDSTLTAALFMFGGQETSGIAVAAIVVRRVVGGAKLANVSVHADVAVRLSMLMAHVIQAGLKLGLRGIVLFILRVVGEVQTFNGGSTLVTDIADDVSNGVSLVSKMTISNIGHAEAIATSVARKWGEEPRLHFWSDFLVVDFGVVAGACVRDCTAGLLKKVGVALGKLAACDGFVVLDLFGHIFVSLLNVVAEFGSVVKGAHNMLHVMSLSVDETAKVQNYTAGFVTLARNRRIRMLESRELLHVAFALSLKLFRNVLLKDERFESIISLLLCAVEALGKACSVIFMLLDE